MGNVFLTIGFNCFKLVSFKLTQCDLSDRFFCNHARSLYEFSSNEI